MTRKRKALVAFASVAVLGGGGAGVAQAVGGDDEKNEPAHTGPDADRAKAAAVQAVGGGTAGDVEREEENGAIWEVEVKKLDGSTVEVKLDGSFAKVAIEADTGSESEDAGK